MECPQLVTDRLLLRAWGAADLPSFAALNADPVVMRFFDHPYTATESDGAADRIALHFSEHGFGLWAVEARSSGCFLGFAGLQHTGEALPFPSCVEIGWRLARRAWGQGYASEAGRAALRFAFEELNLPQVVAFTSESNLPSRRVMERLSMTRCPADDFDHPALPLGHRLRRHVLYRAYADEARGAGE